MAEPMNYTTDSNVTDQSSEDARAIAITRLIVSLIATINLFLVAFLGWSPIPVDDATLYASLSGVAAIIADLWAWWKNNNVTKAAQKAQGVLAELKAE